MTAGELAGVTALSRILVAVAEGRPASVAGLAQSDGLARATSFDVAARLEASGLIRRDGKGRLCPGDTAIGLAFARYGLGALQGHAEGRLVEIRRESGASVALFAGATGDEMPLLCLPAGPDAHAARHDRIEAPIRDAQGAVRARLVMCWPVASFAGRREQARLALDEAALDLGRRLG